ncbi:MAG: MBL fold metallo-hydrolase [Candidatus Diapherotrites archaeon]|nr:MBL fold metallo-hydrolase [Candidatus Diapherotrites archaeon]
MKKLKDTQLTGLMAVVLIISIAALFLGASAYLREPAPATGVHLAEAPAGTVVEAYEGPKYTGTGTGYVIEFENGKRLHFAGDTALISDFKFVIRDHYHPDIGLFPADGFYCMDSKLAAVAASWVNPEYAIPYHYGTFPEMPPNPEEFVAALDELRLNNETRAKPFIAEPGIEWEIEGIRGTWLGHGSYFFVSPGGVRILVDPWLEANPMCPAKFKDIEHFREAYGDIDLVLLTHGHVDHFTIGELIKIWDAYEPVVIAQWELGGYIATESDMPVCLINKGGIVTKEKILLQGIVPPEIVNAKKLDGIKIMMVQAEHSSSPP